MIINEMIKNKCLCLLHQISEIMSQIHTFSIRNQVYSLLIFFLFEIKATHYLFGFH